MRRRLLGLVLLAGAAAVAPCRAQTEPGAAEHQVKAAFLYRFAGYVDWPPSSLGGSDEPFTIGVVGAEALADELVQTMSGRLLHERSVTVRRLKVGESLAGVQMLFIGGPQPPSPTALRQWAQQLPVLVITEAEAGMPPGSMINFVVLERRVRFEIALDAASRSGLKLSSRLLAVAQKVSGGTP